MTTGEKMHQSSLHTKWWLRVRVQCRQIQFQMQIPRVGTKNVLCLSVQVRIVLTGSLSQTVCRNDFLIPIGADFWNLNLPALYAYPNAGKVHQSSLPHSDDWCRTSAPIITPLTFMTGKARVHQSSLRTHWWLIKQEFNSHHSAHIDDW